MKELILALALIGMPAVGEYSTDAAGWSYPQGETSSAMLLSAYRLTPKTIIFLNGKQVVTYPEPKRSFKIINFRINGETFEVINLQNVAPVSTDFNLGGKP